MESSQEIRHWKSADRIFVSWHAPCLDAWTSGPSPQDGERRASWNHFHLHRAVEANRRDGHAIFRRDREQHRERFHQWLPRRAHAVPGIPGAHRLDRPARQDLVVRPGYRPTIPRHTSDGPAGPPPTTSSIWRCTAKAIWWSAIPARNSSPAPAPSISTSNRQDRDQRRLPAAARRTASRSRCPLGAGKISWSTGDGVVTATPGDGTVAAFSRSPHPAGAGSPASRRCARAGNGLYATDQAPLPASDRDHASRRARSRARTSSR